MPTSVIFKASSKILERKQRKIPALQLDLKVRLLLLGHRHSDVVYGELKQICLDPRMLVKLSGNFFTKRKAAADDFCSSFLEI